MLTLVSPGAVYVSSTPKAIRPTNERPAPRPAPSSERPSFLMILLRALGAMHC
jgi:hypothetical protein